MVGVTRFNLIKQINKNKQLELELLELKQQVRYSFELLLRLFIRVKSVTNQALVLREGQPDTACFPYPISLSLRT